MREEDENNIQHGWTGTEDRYKLTTEEVAGVEKALAYVQERTKLQMEIEIVELRASVARLEEPLKEISTLYWVDAPAPEEMRRIARRALEEK